MTCRTKCKDYFYQRRLAVKSFSVTLLHSVIKMCMHLFGDAAAQFPLWSWLDHWLSITDKLTPEMQAWKYVLPGINTHTCLYVLKPSTHHKWLPQLFGDVTQGCYVCAVQAYNCPHPHPYTPLGKRPFADRQHKKLGGSCKGSGTRKETKIRLKIMKRSLCKKFPSVAKAHPSNKHPPNPPASRTGQ